MIVGRARTEIETFSYWEHFKKAKDLALIYPPEHPERVLLQQTLDELSNPEIIQYETDNGRH